MRYPPLPDEQAQAARAQQQARARRAVSRRRAPRSDEQRARDRVYNAIALAFAIASLAVAAAVAFLWTNYNSPLNPLAPPTPFPVVVTATFTPTLTVTPSTTPTPAPTRTASPVPSLAPSLTFTPVSLDSFTTPGTPAPQDGTPQAVSTPAAGEAFPFAVARVIYITNPPGRGACNWASIAGSVVTYEGAAVNGYSVRIVGEGLDETVTTGSAPGNGPGGFEVQIGESARAGAYTAQLRDAAGNPASAVIPVTTRADCAQNIAALRFVAVLPS